MYCTVLISSVVACVSCYAECGGQLVPFTTSVDSLVFKDSHVPTVVPNNLVRAIYLSTVVYKISRRYR